MTYRVCLTLFASRPARRGSRVLAAVALVAALFGCGPTMAAYEPPLQDPGPSQPRLQTADAALRAASRVPAAVASATLALRIAEVSARVTGLTAGFDPTAEATLIAAARIAFWAQRADDGWLLYQAARSRGYDSAELFAAAAEGMLDGARYREARDAAFDGLDQHPDDALLSALGDRAIDEDATLLPPTVRSLQADPGTVLKALGGGSTVTLKLKVGDANVAAIKPDQDLGQSMYRSEIAFFRLCSILRCHFRVPYNEHVRIARSDFEALYARDDSPKQRGYASKFVHLRWKTDPTNGEEYLHATAKEWVPAFTSFPIEASSAWQKYLTAGRDRAGDTPLADWLPTLAEAAGERGWSDHKARVAFAAELPLDALLVQIADVLAMDYLTNNWDRFSGGVELYGANCQMEPGGLVAIDNGASFPLWHTDRVARRLKLTQRFSRRFVNAVRRLDHDKTLQRLFPAASSDELRQFELFWERRTQLLDYVDALVAQHGADEVLVFD